MSTIHKVTFTPAVGETVELPSETGRKSLYRYGGGGGATGHVGCTVVGTGETEPYVILRMDEDTATLPEGAEVLGCDVHNDCMYYAIPKEVYGE